MKERVGKNGEAEFALEEKLEERSGGMRLDGCCRGRLWSGRLVRGVRSDGRAI